MKEFIERHSPPGINLHSERTVFLFGLLLSAVYSMGVLLNFMSAINELYIRDGYRYILKTDAVMPDYRSLIGFYFAGFLILAVCMLLFPIYRYSYFYQGSKSIYLMRRLPQRDVLVRQCFLIPCLAAVVCLAALVVLVLFYFGIYMLFTPRECLQPNQWQKLWGLA